MCIDCYKRLHPKVVIPDCKHNECPVPFKCAECSYGVCDMYSNYIFPKLLFPDRSTEECIQFENLYCLECTWCNHDKQKSTCANCKQDYYNNTPNTNDRCLICIWLHNKAVPEREIEYAPIDMFPNIKQFIPESDKLIAYGKVYIKYNLDRMALECMYEERKTMEKEKKIMIESREIVVKSNERVMKSNENNERKEKQRQLPFGYTIVTNKNKKRNKKNK